MDGLILLGMLIVLWFAIRSLSETKRIRAQCTALHEKINELIGREQPAVSTQVAALSENNTATTHISTSVEPLGNIANVVELVSESPDSLCNELKPVVDTPVIHAINEEILSPEMSQEAMSDAEAEHSSPPQTETIPLKPSYIHSLIQRILVHLEKNWLIWIGGLALVFGIGYLGQFIGGRVEIPPSFRTVATSLLALSFVGFGEFLHRQIQRKRLKLVDVPDKNYIPSTFAAAGMTGLYVNIVFATVAYQLFSPPMALSLTALTGFFCLVLSRRFGSLMAILGLIGGYTAPLWLQGGLQSPYALMAYISVVTAAGLHTQQRIKIFWLPLAIALGHAGWLGTTSASIELKDMALWSLLFYPLSIYLLVAVPHQGFALLHWYRNKSMLPWYHPAGAAALIGVLFIMIASQLPFESSTPFILTCVPLFMLALPAVRRGYSSRDSQLVSVIATLVFIAVFYPYLLQKYSPIFVELALIGLWTVLLLLRAYWQFLVSYRSLVSYWLVVSCGAVMMLITLVFIDTFFPQDFLIVGIASFIGCVGLTWLAKIEPRLKADVIISTHIVLFVLNYLWFDNAIFIALLAIQVVVMTFQAMHQRPLLKNDIMIKVTVSCLLARISFLPFIASWHEGAFSKDWVAVANCLPAILILAYLLKIMREKKMLLGDWFEGAFIHLIAIFVLLQTHYWLTGSFILFDHITITSVSFWLIQALTLVGVYCYRQKSSQSMRSFYQLYCYALLLVATLCLISLNTQFMPLFFETISAAALPIFNGLLLGWCIPGIGLLFLAKQGLLPDGIPVRWIYCLGGSLVALWVAMSIRQFWQSETMLLMAQTSMAEWLTYSVALIVFGTIWTYLGVIRHTPNHKTYGLVIIGIAITKVFLFDMSYLDGLWRAASFLGLGLALIGLGWLFQTLKKHQEDAELSKPVE